MGEEGGTATGSWAPTWREYRPADRAACLTVFESNVPRFFRAEERAEFESFLDALPGPYFVLLDRTDEVVGCGGYAVGAAGAVADLCWGMVRGDRHGEGLGRVLAERRIANLVEDRRVTEIALNTSQHTVAFYERLGFRAAGIHADGYAPGLDRIEMVMKLRP